MCVLKLSLWRGSQPRRQHRRSVPGVVHCFTSSSEEELRSYLEDGLYIGITGWVCDDRPERGGAALCALLPLVPDDRLLLETDAPYLTPRSITWVLHAAACAVRGLLRGLVLTLELQDGPISSWVCVSPVPAS